MILGAILGVILGAIQQPPGLAGTMNHCCERGEEGGARGGEALARLPEPPKRQGKLTAGRSRSPTPGTPSAGRGGGCRGCPARGPVGSPEGAGGPCQAEQEGSR